MNKYISIFSPYFGDLKKKKKKSWHNFEIDASFLLPCCSKLCHWIIIKTTKNISSPVP